MQTGTQISTATPVSGANVLIVDDVSLNRLMLSRYVERLGYSSVMVENGREALSQVKSQSFDLILLDIEMPEMDGFSVLNALKANPLLRNIPVVVISALDQLDNIVRCIELGAEDYLIKPFNPVLLGARLNASLQKKRWHDQEQTYLKIIQAERAKGEQLLMNILPASIVERLKKTPEAIADSFEEVTILFADIVGFTEFAARTIPVVLVEQLNQIFTFFDELVEQHGLEKIKTIGDAYMAVAGLPKPCINHARASMEMALAMQKVIRNFKTADGESLSIRIGLHSGPVVAGVIGIKKFSYDLWGDTVNIASRMESTGLSGRIQVSSQTRNHLAAEYLFEERGQIAIKGKGEMPTYLVLEKVE